MALWIFILAILILVIFSVQNAQEVGFKFFVWKTHLSLSILLIVAFLIGVIVGAFFSFRQQKKLPKQANDNTKETLPAEEWNKDDKYNKEDDETAY